MLGKLLASAAFTITLALCGAANAANVTSLVPQSIVAALQNAGYKALLSQTDEGDPLIQTASDGNTIVIVFTDCEAHQSCKTTEFAGVWDCADTMTECDRVVEKFNKEESPVHIVRSDDRKTATTYSYLIHDKVGISEALFIQNLETFTYYNNQFAAAFAK